jgi:hypothetical protein
MVQGKNAAVDRAELQKLRELDPASVGQGEEMSQAHGRCAKKGAPTRKRDGTKGRSFGDIQ